MGNTNWPDPKRPGVPMFPERKAWHMLDRDVWEWYPSRQAWNDTVRHPNFVEAKDMAWRKYHGPVLTPMQIAEMLAGERERCAKMCTEVSDTYYAHREEAESDDERIYADERMCAAQECAEAIRNLVDAS